MEEKSIAELLIAKEETILETFTIDNAPSLATNKSRRYRLVIRPLKKTTASKKPYWKKSHKNPHL